MGISYNPLSGMFDLTSSGGVPTSVPVGVTLTGSTNNSILVVTSSGTLGQLGPLTTGQILVGVTGSPAIATSSPTITSLTLTSLTANTVLIANGSKTITSSGVSSTTLGFLDATSSIQTQLNSTEKTANKGVANGYAPLDGSAKVSYTNLPSALMTFKGAWDPTTNTPTLANGTGLAGDTYRASVGGASTSPISDTWFAGDFIIYNGTIWQRSPLADGVISVNGLAGAVTLTQGNLTDAGTDGITVTNGTNAVWGTGTSLSQHVADSTHNGYLSSSDWTTFNSKQPALSFTAPLTNVSNTIAINGSIADNKLNFVNASDVTKSFTFDLSGQSTGAAVILQPLSTANTTYNLPPLVDTSGTIVVQNNTSGQVFIGATATIGGANSGIQYSNATTANRGQIKLHSYFNGTSVAGVSTLTSRSGTIGVNAAVVNGQDYSKWTAQAAATTPGSAPISGTFAFKANTVNSLTVTSDFHIQLTNLAGTLADRLTLGSEGDLTVTGNMSATNLSGTNTGDVTLSIANGLSLVGQALSLGLSSTSTTGALSSTDWNTFNNKQASGSYITALTGDVSATGPGSVAATLATVNSNVGTFGSSASIPSFTVNAKGLITAASNNALKVPTLQTFTSGTSATYTTPSGVLYIRVRIAGAGGGGGDSTSGNGTAGTASTWKTSADSDILTANGGGAGGTSGGTALGGAGGTATVAGGAIGTPIKGNPGGSEINLVNSTGGHGGANPLFGGGGIGGTSANAGTAGGTNSGSGGGGNGSITNASGSGGGSGGCCDAIIASPNATYHYTVGAGGTAGGAGAGAGAAGYIEVWEYYQ